MLPLTYDDIKLASERISGSVRRVTVTALDKGAIGTAHQDPLDVRTRQDCEVFLALEFMQHTGSFKARGAANFLAAHRVAGTLPDAGITIASGGNAGLACAWAAQQQGVTATVFVPQTAPPVKVAKLRYYGADVRQVGQEYADALAACEQFAERTGALASHAYDHPLIAAGAGTLFDEIYEQIPGLNTIIVAVGGGGLFTGIATAALHHNVRTIAVEPENCAALNGAALAGYPVDVRVDSIAADSLGARRASAMAVHAAQQDGVHCTVVSDDDIVRARQALWDHRRLPVEHGAAAALAVLTAPVVHNPDEVRTGPSVGRGGYTPGFGERVAVVLCGANTDPTDLVQTEAP